MYIDSRQYVVGGYMVTRLTSVTQSGDHELRLGTTIGKGCKGESKAFTLPTIRMCGRAMSNIIL